VTHICFAEGRVYLYDNPNESLSNPDAICPITFISDTVYVNGYQKIGTFYNHYDIPDSKKESIVIFTEGPTLVVNSTNDTDMNDLFNACNNILKELFSDSERMFKKEARDMLSKVTGKDTDIVAEWSKMFKFGGLLETKGIDDFSLLESTVSLLRHGKIDVKGLNSNGKRTRVKGALTSERQLLLFDKVSVSGEANGEGSPKGAHIWKISAAINLKLALLEKDKSSSSVFIIKSLEGRFSMRCDSRHECAAWIKYISRSIKGEKDEAMAALSGALDFLAGIPLSPAGSESKYPEGDKEKDKGDKRVGEIKYKEFQKRFEKKSESKSPDYFDCCIRHPHTQELIRRY
jgi:hypothetical protein